MATAPHYLDWQDLVRRNMIGTDLHRPTKGLDLAFQELTFGVERYVNANSQYIKSEPFMNILRYDPGKAQNVALRATHRKDPILPILPDAFARAAYSLVAPGADPTTLGAFVNTVRDRLIHPFINDMAAYTPYRLTIPRLKKQHIDFTVRFVQTRGDGDFRQGFQDWVDIDEVDIDIYSDEGERILRLRGSGRANVTHATFLSDMFDIDNAWNDDDDDKTNTEWHTIDLVAFNKIPPSWRPVRWRRDDLAAEESEREDQFDKLDIRFNAHLNEASATIETGLENANFKWRFGPEDSLEVVSLPYIIEKAIQTALRMGTKMTPMHFIEQVTRTRLESILVSIGLTEYVKFHPIGYDPKRITNFRFTLEMVRRVEWLNDVPVGHASLDFTYSPSNLSADLEFHGKTSRGTPKELMKMLFYTLKTPQQKNVWTAGRANDYPENWL